MHKNYIVLKTKDIDQQSEIITINGVTSQKPLSRNLAVCDLVYADEDQLDEIKACPHVISVHEDELCSLPEPLISTQMNLPDVNVGIEMHGAPALWKEKITGRNVRIGVLDTGMDQNHAESTLKKNICSDHNFTNDSSSNDRNGHGTHVAGTIAGPEDIGIAPDVELVIAKVLGNNGSGHLSWIVAGLEWCVDEGAQLVNLSLGGSSCSPFNPVLHLIERIRHKNILPIVAAGNDGCRVDDQANLTSPGCSPDALTIAALDEYFKPASFSSCGDVVDLAAFGHHVYGLWHSGGYQTISGTSMATPHVTGAAALLRSSGYHPNLVWRSLLIGADSMNYDMIHIGVGSLNIPEGLRRLRHLQNEENLSILNSGREEVVKL